MILDSLDPRFHGDDGPFPDLVGDMLRGDDAERESGRAHIHTWVTDCCPQATYPVIPAPDHVGRRLSGNPVRIP